jgi:glycosyltransferase involved in cell wall biosynthesis
MLIMRKCVLIITDGVDGITGPIRVAYLLGKHLVDVGFIVELIAPYVEPQVETEFVNAGFRVKELGLKPPIGGGLGHLWLWMRNALFKIHDIDLGDCMSINLSFELHIKSTIFYAQGYVRDLLSDLVREFPRHYRVAYRLSLPIIKRADANYHEALSSSTFVVANSKYSAEMVMRRGAQVHGIINPPIDTSFFKPVTNPSNDYVLTYVGKETQFNVLRRIADHGIKIVAFGSKVAWMPRWFTKHSNIDYRGRVSDDELTKLYANARFTVFPFIHEPFGYVPVESMACGTPVLTYNKQGPGETVINNETGWLVDTPEDLVNMAIKLWHDGYPEHMRVRARERALMYDESVVMIAWMDLIRRIIGQ